MGIGVVLTALRKSSNLAANFAQRRLLVSLEIPSKDRSYPWFLEWMAAQAQIARARETGGDAALLTGPSASRMAVTQPKPSSRWRQILNGNVPLQSHQLAVETTYKQHDNGSTEALFTLVPGPGTHYFRYQGAWIQLKRERDSKLMDLHSGIPWETVTLTTLSRDRYLFPRLLKEARELADREKAGKTVVYTAWGAEWRPFGKPRRKREVGSVVLAEGQGERVEDDLRTFLSRGKWYADRGIPYRRGYLLHGPPGSGKTSFIQALAGNLNYNICLLNLSERGLTDDKLNHLLGITPERSIVLLEDIDAAFNRRVQTSEDGFKSSVTFSGLLNALDGVASAEERIIFMTTNHFNRLDPALVRPGRVDVKELLDDAVPEQAERLFTRFYGKDVQDQHAMQQEDDQTRPSSSSKAQQGLSGQVPIDEQTVRALASQLAQIVADEQLSGRRVSMAALQGHFIRNGPVESLGDVKKLFGERPTD